MKAKFLRTPANFRAWLDEHHGSTSELLVGFYKRARKASGFRSSCENRAGAELRFGAGFAQARDLDAWRRTEQAPVFAAELRRAFVADTMPGGGAFDSVGKHQPPRFVQPQMLLVLQRGHRSDRLEAVMQRRRTHVHGFGEFLDAQRLRVALLEPLDG